MFTFDFIDPGFYDNFRFPYQSATSYTPSFSPYANFQHVQSHDFYSQIVPRTSSVPLPTPPQTPTPPPHPPSKFKKIFATNYSPNFYQ